MTQTVELTKRQHEIYGYIVSEIESGAPPTIRGIGKHTGIKSPNGVMCHLKALKKKGLIEVTPNVARGIRVVGYETMLVTPKERRELVKQRKAK